jgi:hypothetical protein
MKNNVLLGCLLVIILVFSFTYAIAASERIWLVFDMGPRMDIHGWVPWSGDTDGFIYHVNLGTSELELTNVFSTHYNVITKGTQIAQYEVDGVTYDNPVWIPVAIDITSYIEKPFIVRLLIFQGDDPDADWPMWGAPRILKGVLPELTEPRIKNDIPVNIHDLPEGVDVLVSFADARNFYRAVKKHIVDGQEEEVTNAALCMLQPANKLGELELDGIFTHPPQTEGISLGTFIQWKVEVKSNSVDFLR